MVISPYRTIVSRILSTSVMAFALTACAWAQSGEAPDPSPGPALWTIEDEDTTIHLFGFAPVLKPGTDWETENITQAFDTANLFVIESDNRSPEAQAAVQALIPQIGLNSDGSTLSSKLTEEQRAEVNEVTTALGAPLPALDPLKPWLGSVQIGVLAVSRGEFELANTPSAQLSDKAKQSGTDIRTLEKPTDLMQLMASFPEDIQIGMLLHTARTIRDRPGQQLILANAWLSGDVKLIGKLLHGENGAWSDQSVYDAMLVTRNQAWLGEIKTLLAEHDGTVFFTVGLGHFAGKDSLIAMLEADGIEVSRQ